MGNEEKKHSDQKELDRSSNCRTVKVIHLCSTQLG
jgi:hypothetical protein